MSAAAAVLSGSAASGVAVALLVQVAPPVAGAPLVPVVPAAVPHGPQLPVQVPQELQRRVLAPPVLLLEVPRDLLLNLLSIRLPQVVVESEVTPHLQGRQSFSAAMAKNSPPTVQPTYEQALSSR